jgi:hypothetical protein
MSMFFHSALKVSSCQIHSSLLGDKADYVIRLSYRPASLCSLTGRYVNFIPPARDYEFDLRPCPVRFIPHFIQYLLYDLPPALPVHCQCPPPLSLSRVDT